MFSQSSSSNLIKKDPFKRVIYLMMENHSFDQMLGSLTDLYPHMEGIDKAALKFNPDMNNNPVFQQETYEKQILNDPIHEVPNVKIQLNGNKSDGFVKDFQTNYPKSSAQEHTEIMGFYPRGFLPAMHALAADFIICDHLHSSVPGPTWTNRFFALSGTSMGRVKMPEGISDPNIIHEVSYQTQDTIFDRLNGAKKSWRVYFGDAPLSLVFANQRQLHNLAHYHEMKTFYEDAKGPAANFPEFTFIEPKYLGSDQNDDHPPHNTMKAQKLIADIYNAIRSNEELFQSTLFVIAYDEHGGFYDHVSPPSAIPPDAHKEEYTFDRLGVRVPALLISPWFKKGVNQTVFDHTSLLKYLCDKWQLNPLGERTKQANSIACAFDLNDSPRQDCVKNITVTDADLVSFKPEIEKWNNNDNHAAIHSAVDFFNRESGTQASALSNLSLKASIEKSIGGMLLRCGMRRFGMWLQSDALAHRQARIKSTCDSVTQMITKAKTAANAGSSNQPASSSNSAEECKSPGRHSIFAKNDTLSAPGKDTSNDNTINLQVVRCI